MTANFIELTHYRYGSGGEPVSIAADAIESFYTSGDPNLPPITMIRTRSGMLHEVVETPEQITQLISGEPPA